MLKFTIYIIVVFLSTIIWGLATSNDDYDDKDLIATISLHYLSPKEQNTGDDGYCDFNGLRIREGETLPAPIGMCMKIKCLNATLNSMGAMICPEFQVGPGCSKTDTDLSKRFPECCPKEVCPLV